MKQKNDENYKTNEMDVVYFCRDGENEELVYSIRSICANLKFRKLWIVGGCPDCIKPDELLKPAWIGSDKWQRVHNNFYAVGTNDAITENFVLFNDDFFVMKPTTEIKPVYRCSLYEHIVKIENKYNERPNKYTKLLRKCARNLESKGKTCLSYELHVPMVINRKKLLEILREYPDGRATRTLYGNHFGIGGEQMNDVKIHDSCQIIDENTQFISTDDNSWRRPDIQNYMKNKFNKKSKYEK